MPTDIFNVMTINFRKTGRKRHAQTQLLEFFSLENACFNLIKKEYGETVTEIHQHKSMHGLFLLLFYVKVSFST